MQNKPNNIDKLFQAAFKDAVMEPTPTSWNKIVAAINGKYMVPATWWYAAAAALFLGGIGIGYLWNLPKEDAATYAKAGVEVSAPKSVQQEEKVKEIEKASIPVEVKLEAVVKSTSTLAETSNQTEKIAPKSLKNSTTLKSVENTISENVGVETAASVQPIKMKSFTGFKSNDSKPLQLDGKNIIEQLQTAALYALFAQEDNENAAKADFQQTFGGRLSSGYSNSTEEKNTLANSDYAEGFGALSNAKNVSTQSSAINYGRSIGLGVDGSYPISRKLSVRYGLNFTRWNATELQEVTGDVYELDAFSNAQILVQDVVLATKQYDYRVNFLEVPLTVKWDFLSKKVKAFISTGVSLSYLTSASKIETDGSQYVAGAKRENATPSDGRMPVSLIASTGLEYQLAKGLNIRFEPIFRAQMNKDETLSFNYPFNSISLNTGIYYSIN